MTPEPDRPFETESRDSLFVEFEAELDDWKPLSPEEARDLLRRLPPSLLRRLQPPADPKPPTE